VEPNALEKVVAGDELPQVLRGPKDFYFADVVRGPADAGREEGSLLRKAIRVGDAWAADVAVELLERGTVDVILPYLHEPDHRSHRDGPQA
jgi:hypothetical protein